MNEKVKTIMLAISLACLAGCSDDDSKSNDGEMYSCRQGEVKETIPNEDGSTCVIYKPFFQNETGSCGEMPSNLIKEWGTSVSEVEKGCSDGCDKEISNAVFLNEACPGGYVKKCKSNLDEEDKGLVVYFYGEGNKDRACKKGWIDVD